MTKEQLEYWKSLPETEEIMQKAMAKITEISEIFANGGTLNTSSMESTALNTALSVGKVWGLAFIMGDLSDE